MPYPVIQIDPEWVLEQEQLGTKDKFWIKNKRHEILESNLWLFKYPKKRHPDSQKITGMHWSEKIAYELSRIFRIPSPTVHFATINGEIGSLTENFANEGYRLYHGNQVLANTYPDYDPEKQFQQNDHKIATIMSAIGAIFVKPEMGEEAKFMFAKYLVFDALICNVDRHHENWGFLRKQVEDGGYSGRLAPSYDHASSLGRELQDMPSEANKQSKYRYLNDPQLSIEKYISKGKGPIFIDGEGKRGPSPMKLINRCLQIPELSPYFNKGLESLCFLNEDKISAILAQVPEEWMSQTSKDFAKALLCATLTQLDELRGHN